MDCIVANANPSSTPSLLAIDEPTRVCMRETVRRLKAVGEEPTSLIINLCEGVISPHGSRQGLIRTGLLQQWPYWVCQAQLRDPIEPPGPCVKLPAGQEMAVCAGVGPAQAPHNSSLSHRLN